MQIKLTLPEKPKTARRVRAGKSVWKPRRTPKPKSPKTYLEHVTERLKDVMLQKMSLPDPPWSPLANRYRSFAKSRFAPPSQTNYFQNKEPETELKAEIGPPPIQKYCTFEEVRYARPINPEPPELTPEQMEAVQKEFIRAIEKINTEAIEDSSFTFAFNQWVVRLERAEALKLDLEFDIWAQKMERIK